MINMLETPQGELTIDHTGFYRGGLPFYPVLDELLWNMNLEQVGNPAFFDAHVDQILHFTQEVFPKIKETTLGVLLYQGSYSFDQPLTSDEEEKYADFCLEHPSTAFQLPLFRANLLAEYLHRLIAFFPDDLPVFAFFDVSNITSPTLAAKLLSSCRFKHIHLVVTGSQVPIGITTGDQTPAKLGVCLPQDAACTQEVFSHLDQLFLELREQEYRILSEELLAEEWNGIDELCVLQNTLSSKGKRLLAGFEAAGGIVKFF